MTSFQPCSSCARHVRGADRACPFCGATVVRVRPPAARLPRMSRARWLALGSTVALVGCNAVVASSGGDAGHAEHEAGSGNGDDGSVPPGRDGGVLADAGRGEASSVDEAGWITDSGTQGDGTAQDAEVSADGSVVCSARSGTFACGGQTCDRATQMCGPYGGGCVAYGTVLPNQQPEAGTCGPCPTCACLEPTLWGACYCSEDDGGAIAISCGGCYGAPPARLERIA